MQQLQEHYSQANYSLVTVEYVQQTETSNH